MTEHDKAAAAQGAAGGDDAAHAAEAPAPDARSGTAPAPESSGSGARNVSAVLGERLRTVRARRNLSLRSVARRAHVSASLLSQIERGEANPSLVSLVAIAEALGVRPGTLLDDEQSGFAESPVVRRDERRIIEAAFGRREYLMHLDDPLLEVAELILPPGGYSRPGLAAHSGRDYGLVLSGSVEVRTEIEAFTLGEGDYIAFDSSIPHRVLNDSDEPARILWIIAHDRRPAGQTASPG